MRGQALRGQALRGQALRRLCSGPGVPRSWRSDWSVASTRRGPPAEPLKYFSAWFCPFAHRATIALEHHRAAVPFEWEESLGWETRPPTGAEDHTADDRDDWYYHWKSPALLAANPLGMIPTLQDPKSGRAVSESLVVIQFVDELAQMRGSRAAPLLPHDPFERARARVVADRVNRQVTSRYYQVLVRTDAQERREAFAGLLDGLREFTGELRGDFWGGDSIGLVDCALLPYAWRLYAIEHYRGPEFAVPAAGEGGLWEKYGAWLARMSALPSVAPTLPDKERYLQHVKKYAEGKARSKVGNAVRRGASAHDYDDKLDDADVPTKGGERVA